MNKTKEILLNLAQRAESCRKVNTVFLQKLKQKKPKDLDKVMLTFHNKTFKEIDCLECANCCKSISPAIYDVDVERLSKSFKIKPSEFIARYLQPDTDDYVFRESPCPFLLPDNYCIVYLKRPRACREYPHTDRKRFHQILKITLENSFICPAVFLIIEDLKKYYNQF